MRLRGWVVRVGPTLDGLMAAVLETASYVRWKGDTAAVSRLGRRIQHAVDDLCDVGDCGGERKTLAPSPQPSTHPTSHATGLDCLRRRFVITCTLTRGDVPSKQIIQPADYLDSYTTTNFSFPRPHTPDTHSRRPPWLPRCSSTTRPTLI